MSSELNKRITIQKFTITSDDNGFENLKWIDFKTVWSSINNLFGKEYWEAKSIQAENTINFKIRYSKALKDMDSKNYRIRWNNKNFNIISLDNIKYSNDFIILKGVEVNV